MKSEVMLSVVDAREQLLAGIGVLESEEVETGCCLGRVLAEEIIAPDNVPSFASSSMDGYAVRAIDVATAGVEAGVLLRVAADIPAGSGIPAALQA